VRAKKIKIELPRYGGLGADIGNIIDNVTWSDKVGLDPGESDEPGFQYGEGVPQPASIKPFAFKKLFPSKSAVGSEIKLLPRVRGYGVDREVAYRDILTRLCLRFT